MTHTPCLPPDLRVYAVGDIHGRYDLLQILLEKIRADAGKDGAGHRIIFLGDYIDRGLQSRHVIDHLIALESSEAHTPVFLMGNHEQVMRDIVLNQDTNLLQDWLRFGGRETLLSYGIRPTLLSATPDPAGLLAAFMEKLPQPHIAFLQSMPLSVHYGDYFFCHAGVRPGVPLEAQSERDLAWIRHDFLQHRSPFDKMVVHGHTICDEAEFMPNRINVDTGAYATGCLTALALEGTRQWLIQTKQ